MTCLWKGVSDAESGIMTYSISIGDTPGGQSVMHRTYLAGDAVAYYSPPYALDAGIGYYATLYATNGAGVETSIVSNVFYIDNKNSPPLIMGKLYVASSVENASYSMGMFTKQALNEEFTICLPSTRNVGITFSGIDDAESNVVR